MGKKNKDILHVLIIIVATVLAMIILTSIPGYLRPVDAGDITFDMTRFIIIFLIFDLIMIGIPAGIHYLYVKDYSKMKGTWFFALFGGITGAFFGEIIWGSSAFLIIPYILLMAIYAQFYKKFVWYKVVLTTYLGGMLVENALNRSPIQVPTLMWIAFFTYPYFVTKIWENRKKVSFGSIAKRFKFAIAFSVLLGALSFAWGMPQILIFGLGLPFVISLVYKLIKKKR